MSDLDKRDPNGIAVSAKDFVASHNQADAAIKSAKEGVAEDDDAVAAFLARGGEIQQLKPQRGPKRSGMSLASKHIGSGSGRGNTKGKVSGLGANTGKSGKPVVTAEQGVAEGFNGEYDDEAGMAQSNLITTARAVMGLLKTIKDRDNLPEWGQEKIAKAEMMLVSVWDYLQSQKAMGNDPQQGVAEGDTYIESLQTMMERQLEPTMDLDAWVDNFQNADPQKYHQFKNKTPEKKK